MALGVIRALTVKGIKVPSQISVMGFDDIPDALKSVPTLSTVAQPIEEMVLATCEYLYKCIDGNIDNTSGVKIFQPRLVIRYSPKIP